MDKVLFKGTEVKAYDPLSRRVESGKVFRWYCVKEGLFLWEEKVDIIFNHRLSISKGYRSKDVELINEGENQ